MILVLQDFVFVFVFFNPFYLLLQLEASTNQELNQNIPLLKLPTQILCRIVNMNLLVIFSVIFIFFFNDVKGILSLP
jgi:hypothetical protein